MQLTYLSSADKFPPTGLALAEPNGLLAAGGDLSVERLIDAYQNGIFPWFSAGDPILWWSPDPRAVLLPECLHVSHSLNKHLRKMPYRITLNHAFADVIAACALREEHAGTWITPAIQQAYIRLHQQNIAHSIEVWQDDLLVGGLYGIAQGKIFSGESMFSRQINASKYALIALCQYLIQHGGELIDCQVLNPHTASLGAINISRDIFLQKLGQLRQQSMINNSWRPQHLTIAFKNVV